MEAVLRRVRRNETVDRAARKALLTLACVALRAEGRGRVPSPRVLRWLRIGWSNRNWPASVALLEEVARRAVASPGPIVELGSGLTTVVLSHVVQRDQLLVTLEHLPDWAVCTGRYVRRGGHCEILVAPLTSKGDHDWYDVESDDLPVDIGLLIVDGPPALTRGGRYGALPVAASKLASSAIVLVDDATREGERLVIERWCQEFGLTAELIPDGSSAFAVLRFADDSRQRNPKGADPVW